MEYINTGSLDTSAQNIEICYNGEIPAQSLNIIPSECDLVRIELGQYLNLDKSNNTTMPFDDDLQAIDKLLEQNNAKNCSSDEDCFDNISTYSSDNDNPARVFCRNNTIIPGLEILSNIQLEPAAITTVAATAAAAITTEPKQSSESVMPTPTKIIPTCAANLETKYDNEIENIPSVVTINNLEPTFNNGSKYILFFHFFTQIISSV